jgi:hypothetical protein
MDFSMLFAGPLGGVLGWAGSIAQKWLGMKEKKADHEMEMQRLEVMSKIDLQKADILFRGTVEEKAGESFSKAIDAQAAMRPASPWAQNTMALFRPGLTLVLMLASTGLAIYYHDAKPELLEFIITSMFTMSSVACGYWFGVRTDEKTKVTQAFAGKRL